MARYRMITYRSGPMAFRILCMYVCNVCMWQGVNGSGKHNNWSIATNDGTNILNVAQLAKNSGSSDIFPIVMAAIVKVRSAQYRQCTEIN